MTSPLTSPTSGLPAGSVDARTDGAEAPQPSAWVGVPNEEGLPEIRAHGRAAQPAPPCIAYLVAMAQMLPEERHSKRGVACECRIRDGTVLSSDVVCGDADNEPAAFACCGVSSSRESPSRVRVLSPVASSSCRVRSDEAVDGHGGQHRSSGIGIIGSSLLPWGERLPTVGPRPTPVLWRTVGFVVCGRVAPTAVADTAQPPPPVERLMPKGNPVIPR